MKKLLLASAIAALSVSAAQAAPTVYGKAFLTLDVAEGDLDTTVTTANNSVKTSEDIKGRTHLNSNASRIGIKGSEAITANTDVVYQLEYGVDIDAGDRRITGQSGNADSRQASNQFYARDTYIGLSNKQYGTLIAGRITTIDDQINFVNVTDGGVLGGDDILASVNALRANNSFAYMSPNYNGTSFMAMYAMDENEITDNVATFKSATGEGRDAFGVGVKYEQGMMNVGATYIQAGDDVKTARVSGNYQVAPAVVVGGLYQYTDFDTDKDEHAFAISGEMKTMTPWTAYAQGDIVTNVEGVEDNDAYRLVVGGKYAFNKATTGHVYGAYLNLESESENAAVRTKTELDAFGIGAGLEYKF